MSRKFSRKKTKKFVEQGVVNIQATFNNTIITISDMKGNVIAWSSGGNRGFKGTRKGTPFAAQVASEDATKKAKAYGLKSAHVYVSGPGPGREPAIRAVQAAGVKVLTIKDVTPIPHNGCRPPGRRRV